MLELWKQGQQQKRRRVLLLPGGDAIANSDYKTTGDIAKPTEYIMFDNMKADLESSSLQHCTTHINEQEKKETTMDLKRQKNRKFSALCGNDARANEHGWSPTPPQMPHNAESGFCRITLFGANRK